MAIVDAHTHIFPPEIIRRRERIAEKEKAFSLLYGDGRARMVDAAGLSEYIRKEGVERAFVLSFPFNDKGLLRVTNDYILESSKEIPIVPFILVDPKDVSFSLSEIERCFDLGARGVGEIGSYGGSLGEEELRMMEPLVECLEKKGGILSIHVNEQVGHGYAGKTFVDFRALYSFIERHGEATIILAHLGGGLCFFEFMPEVRRVFRNVYYDLAAAPFLYDSRMYAFVEMFLAEKTLFGSDFPLLPYSRYAKGMEGISPLARDMILHKNAERLLNDRLG